MNIEEVKARAEQWEPVDPHKLKQGHLANTAAADRAFLLRKLEEVYDSLPNPRVQVRHVFCPPCTTAPPMDGERAWVCESCGEEGVYQLVEEIDGA